jgi:hypothetical protein
MRIFITTFPDDNDDVSKKKETTIPPCQTAAIQGPRTVKPDKPAERETPEEAKRTRMRGMRIDVGVERIANDQRQTDSGATTITSRATRDEP